MMSITTVIVSLSSGAAIDRFGSLRVLPFLLLPMGGASTLLGVIDHELFIFVVMGLIGITQGMVSILVGTLWPEIYGTKHLGSVRSVVLALIVFASAIGPGLTGVLIDNGISFEIQLHTMAIYCLVASLLMFFVAKALIRRRHLLHIGVTRQP